MKTLRFALILSMGLITLALRAQVVHIDVKVTDVNGKVTYFKDATCSAASGCASPDFPVMVDGVKEQRQLEDYQYITVMPYQPSSNEALYVTVELERPAGGTQLVEMSKHLRFSGSSDDLPPLVLKDISMIEVIKKDK